MIQYILHTVRVYRTVPITPFLNESFNVLIFYKKAETWRSRSLRASLTSEEKLANVHMRFAQRMR